MLDKIKIFTSVLIAFLFIGCAPRYRRTTPIADHIFKEDFNVNPAGVDAVYLTDSVNFRIFIGEYDFEHENISCTLEGDTLDIFKNVSTGPGPSKVKDRTKLSLQYLIQNKVHSDTPLFKFR